MARKFVLQARSLTYKDLMPKNTSGQLLAASMDQIISSPNHQAMFAKPRVKQAAAQPMERAVSKLIQASEVLDDLQLTASSQQVLELLAKLSHEAKK